RSVREELEAARSLAAGGGGVRAVAGLGAVDRPGAAAVLPGAGASGGADRGAGAAGVLRGASFGESAGGDGSRGGAVGVCRRLSKFCFGHVGPAAWKRPERSRPRCQLW